MVRELQVGPQACAISVQRTYIVDLACNRYAVRGSRPAGSVIEGMQGGRDDTMATEAKLVLRYVAVVQVDAFGGRRTVEDAWIRLLLLRETTGDGGDCVRGRVPVGVVWGDRRSRADAGHIEGRLWMGRWMGGVDVEIGVLELGVGDTWSELALLLLVVPLVLAAAIGGARVI